MNRSVSLFLALAASAAESPSDHARSAPVEWRLAGREVRNGMEIRDVTFPAARRHVVRPEWFRKRIRAQDLKNSLEQLRELRHSRNPARNRIASHTQGTTSPRAAACALQARTTSFTSWYLSGPPMPEPARSQFLRDLSVLDPAKHIAQAAAANVKMRLDSNG